MSRSRVVRTASDTYRVPCNQCGHLTEFDHHQFPSDHRKFKVTCECGHVSRVLLERRRETRKPVKLSGYLFTLGTKDQQDDITIVELSINGLGFIPARSEVHAGDQFTIGFFLDDRSVTWIEQDIESRIVHDSGVVGAAFINPEQYSLDLDFYLMRATPSD